MKKAIPVLVALAIVFGIAGYFTLNIYREKYSYSEERLDLAEYYQVTGNEKRLIFQDEITEDVIIKTDEGLYIQTDKAKYYLNDTFYVDSNENLLLFTDALTTIRSELGASTYYSEAEEKDFGKRISFIQGEDILISLDFIRLLTNFSYNENDYTVQINTSFEDQIVVKALKDTAVREKGGVKSPIMEDVKAGDELIVLEKMETWCKVKTASSVMGYVENKLISENEAKPAIPVTDYSEPEFAACMLDEKVCVGFHAIAGVAGNETLPTVINEGTAMNVIAPTWFSVCSEQGDIRDFSSASYVTKAHEKGLKVWAVLDDFNYENDNSTDVDLLSLLSFTSRRQVLEENVVNRAVALSLDGINLDFETVNAATGPHFVQFVRELSVLCHKNALTLSVDNYVPFNFNNYYRLDVQGKVCDYVMIMGYDEHWHGSDEVGSVAGIDYVKSGIEKAAQDVPSGKIVNLMPLYTILWKTQGNKVSDEYLTMNNMEDFLSRISAKPEWDEETCQNYMEWNSGDALYQIWLEDADSISVKLNVAKAADIGGVGVWRLGYGTDEVWGMLEAYMNQQ